MTEHRGIEVLRDMGHGGHVIYWNGSATFSVWSALGNDFTVRALREVNVFTNYDAENGSQDNAERIAADWWDSYGREATLDVELHGAY